MLSVLALVFSLHASAADLPHLDKDFSCFKPEEAERYIADFEVDTGSFGGLELCDGTKDTKKLLNDFYLIEKTEFGADAAHPFIRGYVDRDRYYDWMKSQTRGVNRGHDIPYATAYNSWGYFTMQDGWAALSTLGRVGTIIHEARHTAGYRHYACEHGPYANSSVAGCDTSYEQGGSHAIEMEYYARVVLESKNLNPVYKSMARLMALGRSNFVFNKTPMQTREGLLARAGNQLTLIDGHKVTEHAAPALGENYRLKRTSFGASLVAGTSARAIDLYDAAAASVEKTDDYSYYKQFQIARPSGPESFNAIEEYDVGKMRYLTVLDARGQVYNYDFPNGEWEKPVAAPAGTVDFITTAPNGARGLFARTADGLLYPFLRASGNPAAAWPRNPFDPKKGGFGEALADRYPEAVASYAFAGAKLVALGKDGSVKDVASGSSLPALAGRYTDLINVPLYDAFEVAP